jgi:hypothetical protein
MRMAIQLEVLESNRIMLSGSKAMKCQRAATNGDGGFGVAELVHRLWE